MRISNIALIFLFIIEATNAFYFNASRIIVIADVHGDLKRLKYILQDADVIDKNDKWIAKPNTVIVQLGDQIDPKTSYVYDEKHHFDVVYYTDKLEQIAKMNSCLFMSIIGNHEQMNMDRMKNKSDLIDIISNRYVVAIINNYLFCHGSLKLNHHNILQKYGKTLSDINVIWRKYAKNTPMTNDETSILDDLILNTSESILYTKHPDERKDIEKLLDIYDVDYMMVGHLVTKYIHLKNRIWYLDQLIKDAFENGIYSYVTIVNDNIVINTISSYLKIYDYTMFWIS